jgi:hypothetical protein
MGSQVHNGTRRDWSSIAPQVMLLVLCAAGLLHGCGKPGTPSNTALANADSLLAAGKYKDAYAAYTAILNDAITAQGSLDSPVMIQVHINLVKCQLKGFGPDQGLMAAHLLASNFGSQLTAQDRDSLAAWLEAEGATEAAERVRRAK